MKAARQSDITRYIHIMAETVSACKVHRFIANCCSWKRGSAMYV